MKVTVKMTVNTRIAALAGTLIVTLPALACLAITGCSDRPSRIGADGSADAPDGKPSIKPSDAANEPAADATPGAPADGASAEVDNDGSTPDVNVGIEKTGRPLPEGVPPPRRLLGPEHELTGSGTTKCTHQEPPSGNGDRWCAFSRPTGDRASTELWVINVTAAATGQVPPCDGTSPACLRLATTLETTSANAFDGDTLIFYTDSITDASGEFVGPVSAWRPGWSQGRQIAPAHSIFCRGHDQSAAAACLIKPADSPSSLDQGQLLVGLLETEADGLLPALIDGASPPAPLLINRDSNPEMGFSPDGETFALTTAPSPAAVSSMQVVPTRDVATTAAREIIPNVRFWTIAADGKKVYFPRDDATGASLNIADFPAGGAVTRLTSKLRSYIVLGSGAREGVGYLTPLGDGDNTGLAFHLLTDRDAPASALTVFSHQGSLEGVVISPDLRYTVWLDAQFRGQLVTHDGLATCTLNSSDRRRVFLPMFSQSAGLLFWTEPSEEDASRLDAFLAPPDRCREQQLFARGIEFYDAVGDRGIILGDEHDAQETVTLKYAPLSMGGASWPADGPVRVAERVKAPVTLVGDDPLLIVYRVVGDGQQEAGIYLFGPVPF